MNLVNKPQINGIQKEHLVDVLGGDSSEYTKLVDTDGITFDKCKEYIDEHSAIIKQHPKDMFELNAMLDSNNFTSMNEAVDKGITDNKLTVIPPDEIRNIDVYLRDNNIKVTRQSRYCEYKKRIAVDEINLLNYILEGKHKKDLNKAINNATNASNPTPSVNVTKSSNTSTKKNKHHLKSTKYITMKDILRLLCVYNRSFIHSSTSDLKKLLIKHGLTSVNSEPIHGIKGKSHYVYDIDQVTKILKIDAVIKYATNYTYRNKKNVSNGVTKREMARTLPVVKDTELKVDELISIESISKTLNKVMTLDSLAKNGLIPVGKVVSEVGSVLFMYNKTEVENAKLDSNILDLSNFTQDQINAITLITKCK